MTDSSVMIDIPLEPLGVPFGKFDGGDITGTIGSIGDGIENGEKGSNNGKEDEGVDAPDGGGDSDTLSNVTSPPIRSYEVSFPGDLFPRIAKPYVLGDKSEVTISSGNIFIGRKMGGKTRDQIYGTRQYGSGYFEAETTGDRGVAGRNFPFWFWPISWGGAASDNESSYLHVTEYGPPDNSSRPGGIMMTAKFVSRLSLPSSSTFQFLSDHTTTHSIIHDVIKYCPIGDSYINYENTAIPYISSFPTSPKPEQAVQYYRGSTAVLTLDGYNNTIRVNGTDDIPLPKDVDEGLLNCLNSTIGEAIILVDGISSSGRRYFPDSSSIALAYLLWIFVGILFM